MRRAYLRGFTLLELLVVVVVVAVLAAVALPSYSESLAKARRAEAKTGVMQAMQFMQRYYVANDRYDRDRTGAAVALPAGLAQSPPEGQAHYLISLVPEGLSATTFTVQAVPQRPDRCGTLRMNERGQKFMQDGAPGASITDCWK